MLSALAIRSPRTPGNVPAAGNEREVARVSVADREREDVGSRASPAPARRALDPLSEAGRRQPRLHLLRAWRAGAPGEPRGRRGSRSACRASRAPSGASARVRRSGSSLGVTSFRCRLRADPSRSSIGRVGRLAAAEMPGHRVDELLPAQGEQSHRAGGAHGRGPRARPAAARSRRTTRPRPEPGGRSPCSNTSTSPLSIR